VPILAAGDPPRYELVILPLRPLSTVIVGRQAEMTENSKSWRRAQFLSAFALLLLCGCEAREEPAKRNSEAEQRDIRESQLLAEPAKARPELMRRLRASVSLRDGLIVVKGQFGQGMAILPVGTPWVVICGVADISVHFGSAVAEHDGSVSVADALNVPLALTVAEAIPEQSCAELGPAVGKEIQSIVGGK
jgi:hypothetical protein